MGLRPLTCSLLLMMTLAGAIPASAHSMYQSAVLLDFRAHTVDVELQLPVDRLAIAYGRPVDGAHFAAERNALKAYVMAHVHPVAANGQPFAVALESLKLATVENAPYVVAKLVLTPPAGQSAERFTLHYDAIAHEIVTHVVLVSVRSDAKQKFQPEEPLTIAMIRGPLKSVVIDRSKPWS